MSVYIDQKEESKISSKPKLYTQTELNKAVQDEREACASSIDEFVKEQRKIKEQSNYSEFDAGFEACMTLLTEREEAIRAKTK